MWILRAHDSSCSWLLSILRSLKANKKTLYGMEWSGKEEVFNYGVFRMIRAEGGGNTGGSPFRVDGWWQNNETFAV